MFIGFGDLLRNLEVEDLGPSSGFRHNLIVSESLARMKTP